MGSDIPQRPHEQDAAYCDSADGSSNRRVRGARRLWYRRSSHDPDRATMFALNFHGDTAIPKVQEWYANLISLERPGRLYRRFPVIRMNLPATAGIRHWAEDPGVVTHSRGRSRFQTQPISPQGDGPRRVPGTSSAESGSLGSIYKRHFRHVCPPTRRVDSVAYDGPLSSS